MTSSHNLEKRIDALEDEQRRAEVLKADDGDGPALGELTEKQAGHIDAVLTSAWKHPKALREAEEQLQREREERPGLSDGLTDCGRSLLDALTGGRPGGGGSPRLNHDYSP